ncbi:MAG: hypothetical protein KZQ64_06265 [gamma proteobacterium symbiont of Bathyaustriella thionipta]|nr:hypothetical protein [gamma proteobacterium symbiont of Bathyaustriella thionipta]MCU7952976.1 hypothetical protein [gamma proteobacterium symbiont of Bathyaustriella thionipta]MCU7957922.1 hypothetical protein [gamma proteobacterium symbiont of Bathyaustriella thionipta]MCU7968572.1 hypothetical protein [gamma proteobacterium symbiont of Bathyaustriella thionipta]
MKNKIIIIAFCILAGQNVTGSNLSFLNENYTVKLKAPDKVKKNVANEDKNETSELKQETTKSEIYKPVFNQKKPVKKTAKYKPVNFNKKTRKASPKDYNLKFLTFRISTKNSESESKKISNNLVKYFKEGWEVDSTEIETDKSSVFSKKAGQSYIATNIKYTLIKKK